MDTSKRILILSTQRSGTFFLADIITKYIRKKNCNMSLGRACFHSYAKRDKNFDIESDKYKDIYVYHAHFSKLNSNREEIAKKSFGQNIILLTRRNIWEQYLSYYLTKKTGLVHYRNRRKEEEKINHLNDIAREGTGIYIRNIGGYIDRLCPDLDQWSGCPHMYYEDWSHDPLNQIPKLIPEFNDLKDYVTSDDLVSMNKKIPYPMKKEEIFSNIDEAKKEFNRLLEQKIGSPNGI